MKKIGLLEDREDFRSSMMSVINHLLPRGWQCVEVPLLPDPNQYSEWLIRERVDALMADFRLNEASEGSAAPVHYFADKVIDGIRTNLPVYPIYILTAVPDHADLIPKLGDTESVMRRTDFMENPRPILLRIIRAARRFSEEFSQNLAELGHLAAKEARGIATDPDKERILAIQTLIGFGDFSLADYERHAMLEELEAKLKRLEGLKSGLEKLI